MSVRGHDSHPVDRIRIPIKDLHRFIAAESFTRTSALRCMDHIEALLASRDRPRFGDRLRDLVEYFYCRLQALGNCPDLLRNRLLAVLHNVGSLEFHRARLWIDLEDDKTLSVQTLERCTKSLRRLEFEGSLEPYWVKRVQAGVEKNFDALMAAPWQSLIGSVHYLSTTLYDDPELTRRFVAALYPRASRLEAGLEGVADLMKVAREGAVIRDRPTRDMFVEMAVQAVCDAAVSASSEDIGLVLSELSLICRWIPSGLRTNFFALIEYAIEEINLGEIAINPASDEIWLFARAAMRFQKYLSNDALVRMLSAVSSSDCSSLRRLFVAVGLYDLLRKRNAHEEVAQDVLREVRRALFRHQTKLSPAQYTLLWSKL